MPFPKTEPYGADRGVVLDVCPVPNVRTRVVGSLAGHLLPALVAAGVPGSVSTDDPAITDLTTDYAAAIEPGVPPHACYAAGVRGALCDEATRAQLARIGAGADWDGTALAGNQQHVEAT